MSDDIFFNILDALRDIDAKLEKLLEFYMAANNIRESDGVSADTNEIDFSKKIRWMFDEEQK